MQSAEEITVSDISCCICWSGVDLDTPRIRCQKGHYMCKECLIGWMKALSDEKFERTDQFSKRCGRIYCPHCPAKENGGDFDCCGDKYSHADVLATLLSQSQQMVPDVVFVVDDYICNVLHLAEVEQHELMQNKLESIFSNGLCNGSSFADTEKVRLQELANSLRLQFPGARQCIRCNFGPILKDSNCDDLISHNGQSLSNTAGKKVATIDNSCPRCGQLSNTWVAMPMWDGILPSELVDSTIQETIVATASTASKHPLPLSELVECLQITIDDLLDGMVSRALQIYYKQAPQTSLSDPLDVIRNELSSRKRQQEEVLRWQQVEEESQRWWQEQEQQRERERERELERRRIHQQWLHITGHQNQEHDHSNKCLCAPCLGQRAIVERRRIHRMTRRLEANRDLFLYLSEIGWQASWRTFLRSAAVSDSFIYYRSACVPLPSIPLEHGIITSRWSTSDWDRDIERWKNGKAEGTIDAVNPHALMILAEMLPLVHVDVKLCGLLLPAEPRRLIRLRGSCG